MRHVSKKRRKIENELLFYLRNYRFFASRFQHINELDQLISDIVEEKKSDV